MRLAPAVVDDHGGHEGYDMKNNKERDEPRVSSMAARTTVAGGEEGELGGFLEGFGS